MKEREKQDTWRERDTEQLVIERERDGQRDYGGME